MPKKPGAGSLLTASKGIQAVEPKLWRNVAKNFPIALTKLENNLTSDNATPQELMQAIKFYTDVGMKLMKEHRGKKAEDFADQIKDKSGRKKNKDKGNGLIKLTFDGTND